MIARPLPTMGDVIESPKFAFGRRGYNGEKVITVDGKTRSQLCERSIDADTRVALAAATGEVPPETITEDLGAYDESRAKAKFVVESARMEGGSHGRDEYPDGWHIIARRLSEDDDYDPDGEVIQFYMTGCFNCKIAPADVQIVGKMHMRFVQL